jgi:hypothetical protein
MNTACSYLFGLILTQRVIEGRQQKEGNLVYDMVRHSFDSGLLSGIFHATSLVFYLDSTLSDWTISGSSISLPDYVQIVPAVSKRSGFFAYVITYFASDWSRHNENITSDHFISTIDLNSFQAGGGSDARAPSDQLVGFWYSAGNVSADFLSTVSTVKTDDWSDVLVSRGFALKGVVPPNFSGVGVVLSYSTGKAHIISLGGTVDEKSFRLPDGSFVLSDFDFRKPGVKLTLSANRKRKMFGVYFYQSNKYSSHKEIQTEFIPKSGFLTVTGFSGSSGSPFNVQIPRMKTINLDIKSGSGEGHDVVGDKYKIDVSELIHDDEFEELSRPLHQIGDIKKATSILSEYLADSRYRDSMLSKSLSDIQGRAHVLQDAINDLRAEIGISFKTGGHPGAKTLLGEIKGLEELMRLHSEESQSLDGLKLNLKKLGEAGARHDNDPDAIERISASNRELEEEVSRANFTANLVIGIFGLTVLVFGLLLYVKMRQYEKKHFL